MASKDATHFLLLNSDVEIKDKDWLYKLVQLHDTEGITAFGCVKSAPLRADGYCLLIDRWLYEKYRLDESFEWWWSVTKLESQVLKEGLCIRAVDNHESLLHHFGGASGRGWVNAKGMDIGFEEVVGWFVDKKAEVRIIDRAD